MIEIRLLRPADIAFATSLTDVEEWGHMAADFERLIDLDPAGCFIAWENTERVGIATTISYDEFAFLGNVIVKKGKRGRNIGPALMEHALGYLEKRSTRTIELDGVMPAVAMYHYLGFKDKYQSLRFARRPKEKHHSARQLGSCPGPVAISLFDCEMTGIRRKRLIEKLTNEFPDSIFCIDGSHLRAYAIVRERANGTVAMGPIVAEDAVVFAELLSVILHRFSARTITIGIPEVNAEGVKVLLNNGFTDCAPSMRMYRGSIINYEEHVFGIASADVG